MNNKCTLIIACVLSITTFLPVVAIAQTFFAPPKSFVIQNNCTAFTSIKKKTNPVPVNVGQQYVAHGENKKNNATHVFIQVGEQRKWLALNCGKYDDNGNIGGDLNLSCLPFFDEKDNPDSNGRDLTPPAPEISDFGNSVNELCGVPGNVVSRNEFKQLFSKHPDVLQRIQAFTENKVFADRAPRIINNEYLDDLTEAWFAIKGFDHIFCGEPNRGGSIGGMHYRGRYLQLQEQRLACRLPNNHHNEELKPGLIYTVGVKMKVDGGTANKAINGYGLTLSAEDIFKVVTRAFAENPTTSGSSKGCLQTVQDGCEKFDTVFVRRNNGIRTFFPDATPDRNRNDICSTMIALPNSH